jgi:hypothetical protein
MPFIFSCSQCGRILYEDPSPLLQGGYYKSPTYFERVLMKLGPNCPSCRHELHVPPSNIEIFAPTRGNGLIETRRKRKVFHHTKVRRQLAYENEEAHVEYEREFNTSLILLSAATKANTKLAEMQKHARSTTDATE